MRKKLVIIIACILFIILLGVAIKNCQPQYKDVLWVKIDDTTYSTTYYTENGYHVGGYEQIQCKEANGYLYVKYLKNGEWVEFSVKDSEHTYTVAYS